MLHVHRAERADRLVAALADVLSNPLEDPFQAEVVAVHSRGIERWIAQELSTVLGTGERGGDGVCANVDFPFPARLIRTAVAQATGGDLDHDPWLPERLTWPLLGLVTGRPDDHDLLGPLATHVGGTAADPQRLDRRLGAVRHVADLFDRYGVHRPEMVRAWKADRDSVVGPGGDPLPSAHHWQPRLWRALRQVVGQDSFAERHAAAIRAIVADAGVLDLPDRITLFGVTAVPASYLEIAAAIAERREVHLMLLHPSPALWGRVQEMIAARGPRLWLRKNDPTGDLVRNRLLGTWGRDVRELQLLSAAGSVQRDEHHHHSDMPAPRTLLQRLQHDLRSDVQPARVPAGSAGDPRPVLDPRDTSVQLHSCHGRLRQVEVLRDAILHELAGHPDLEPRDIIVMCPDIESFAPLVTAVFGADAVVAETSPEDASAAPPALRVRLADRSVRRTNPVLDVVSLLLDMADNRITASGVLDLVDREPVRRRFRLDDDEVALLESWIPELGIRWGLDGQDRRRQGLVDIEANTFAAGSLRLALGITMADEDLRHVRGVVPYDGVEGQDSDLAGRLIELIRRLHRATEELRRPQPLADWQQTIGAAADAITVTGRDTDWQRMQLHRVLDELVEEATHDGDASPVDLTLGEVTRLLQDRLSGRPSRTSHRTGDLTVSTLVPMRSVPHRVVCLLGMDDGAFPRQTIPDADDLLLLAPRIGDRDARSEDRQLLLDAVMAATDSLIITFAGRHERTNEPRPPAVPVDELLDVLDATVRVDGEDRARDQLVVQHPLQSYDRRSFAPGALRPDDAVWSFDRHALQAAQASTQEPVPVPPFLSGSLDLPAEDIIELDGLVSFLQHPVRGFVEQRLDIRLPTPEDQISDAIPAGLSGLDAWKIGQALLDAWWDGRDRDRALEVLRGRGALPPGDLADADLPDICDRVDRIIDLCGRIDLVAQTRHSVDVDIALPDGRRLIGTVPDVAGDQLQQISYSKIAPKHRLAAWTRLLALLAEDGGRPWSAVTIGRHPWKKGGRAQAVMLDRLDRRLGDDLDPQKAAVAHLERLVDLYDRGRRDPLPLYCATSNKYAEERSRPNGDVTRIRYEWQTNPYRGFAKEDLDPYHLLVLGDQIPATALLDADWDPCRDDEERSWADDDRRFVAYAWRLWGPILRAERSREA